MRERARECGGNDGRLVRIVVAGGGPASFGCKGLGPRSIAVSTGVTMARASGTGK